MGVHHNSNEEDNGRNICHILLVGCKYKIYNMTHQRYKGSAETMGLRVQVYMSFDLPNVTVLSILTADNLNVTSLTTASHYMKTDQIRIYKSRMKLKHATYIK